MMQSIQADFEELRKKLQASDSERITSNDKVFSLVKQNKASEEKNKDLANQITVSAKCESLIFRDFWLI